MTAHASHSEASLPMTGDHALHADHAMDAEHEAHAPDEHAAHTAAMSEARYQVSTVAYDFPDVTLLDDSGAKRPLASVLADDRPIALNFIFTTCTTICPVMTATFAQTRNLLGNSADAIDMVSISIDPEYDRPEVLEAYAGKFGADVDGWTFLTGDSADIIDVLTSFDVYAGSKMNHQPATLLRRAGEASWIRIDGLASGADLAREINTRLLN